MDFLAFFRKYNKNLNVPIFIPTRNNHSFMILFKISNAWILYVAKIVFSKPPTKAVAIRAKRRMSLTFQVSLFRYEP